MKITDTHVYFYSGKEIYSNWHTTPNQFLDPNSGLHFNTTEQHFMWSKAMFFGDTAAASLAAKTTDPREVKALGRKVLKYNDKAWECVRLGFMTYANLLKYQQNPEWGQTLKDTGNRILVEASPYDTIWGVGLGETDPLILNEAAWKGRNLLGIALMAVRAAL